MREKAKSDGTKIVIAALFIPLTLILFFKAVASTGGSPFSRSAKDPIVIEVVHFDENDVGLVGTYESHTSDVSWNVSGVDREQFVIDSDGRLSFKTPPNYESADDADGNNVYEVTIEAETGVLRHTGRLAVSVHVTDVEDLLPHRIMLP